MINKRPTTVMVRFACTNETTALNVFRVVRATLPPEQQSAAILEYNFIHGRGHVTCELPSVSQQQLEMFQSLKTLLCNIQHIVFLCTGCKHSEHIANEGQTAEHCCIATRACTRCGHLFTPVVPETTKCLACILLIGLEEHRASRDIQAALMARNLQER